MSGNARWRWLVLGLVVVGGLLVYWWVDGNDDRPPVTPAPAVTPAPDDGDSANPGDDSTAEPPDGTATPTEALPSACGPVERVWTDRQVAVVLGPEGTPTVTGVESEPRMQTPQPQPPLVIQDGDSPKLHPVVRGWLTADEQNLAQLPDTFPIVVTLDDQGYIVPPLPTVVATPGTPGTPPTPGPIQDCITEILSARNKLTASILSTPGTGITNDDTIEQMWVVPAFAVTTTLDVIRRLGNSPSVVYIEPNNTGYGPPSLRGDTGLALQSTLAQIQPVDAANHIGLELPFKSPTVTGNIALVDTGVVDGLSFIAAYDCADGFNSDCDGGNPKVDPDRHGSAAVEIMNNLGIEGIRSVKVYGFDGAKREPANVNDIVRGIQKVDNQHQVILVQTQPQENPALGAVAGAADYAFTQGGAIIIAPSGNLGQHRDQVGVGSYAGMVAAPASAHLTLAIGAYDVNGGIEQRLDTQRIGHAPDGRVKPDLLFPTNIQTTVRPNPLSNTSGAAAVAAAAAVHIRNWMNVMGKQPLGSSYEVAPGEVYAFMINSGKEVSLPSQGQQGFRKDIGGGIMKLDADSHYLWGRVELLADTHSHTVPIPASAIVDGLIDATIWWPEDKWHSHYDLDLTIHVAANSGPVRVARSEGCHTVFEHARTLIAAGDDVGIEIAAPSGRAQDVYWVVRIDPTPAAGLEESSSGYIKPTCTSRPIIGDPVPTEGSDPPDDPNPSLPRPHAVGKVVSSESTCTLVESGTYTVRLRNKIGSACTGTILGTKELPDPISGYEAQFAAIAPGIGTPTPSGPFCIEVEPDGSLSSSKDVTSGGIACVEP